MSQTVCNKLRTEIDNLKRQIDYKDRRINDLVTTWNLKETEHYRTMDRIHAEYAARDQKVDAKRAAEKAQLDSVLDRGTAALNMALERLNNAQNQLRERETEITNLRLALAMSGQALSATTGVKF